MGSSNCVAAISFAYAATALPAFNLTPSPTVLCDTMDMIDPVGHSFILERGGEVKFNENFSEHGLLNGCK